MFYVNISFPNNKLEKIFSSAKELKIKYGEVRGKVLQRRIDLLQASPCLDDVPKTKPFHCHELKLNRKGQFAIDIVQNWRLTFEPNNRPLPLKDDGGLNLQKINEIKIIDVEDYHGD